MNSFTEFKKELGYSSKELEGITGYTRQGLYKAINSIKEGKKPNRKILVCINAAIEKKMQQEIKDHEEKMNKLRNFQNEFLELEG